MPIIVLSQLSRAPGSAVRQAADAVGPARIGRARAGCGRGDHDLPRGDVQGRRSPSRRRPTASPSSSSPSSATARPGTVQDGLHRGADQVHAPRPRHVIRCTSARVDLAAIRANYRALAAYLATRGRAQPRGRGTAAARRRPSSRSSRPTPTVTAPCRWRARSPRPAPSWLAVADIEEGIELREAGIGGRILVFGALSVSDLDGRLHPRPDADDLESRRRAGARRRGRRPRRAGCGVT